MFGKRVENSLPGNEFETNKSLKPDKTTLHEINKTEPDEESSERMYIKCNVGETEIFALVDTGASHTVISTELMERLRKSGTKLNLRDADVILADGSEVPIIGTAVVPITLPSNSWTGTCVIMKNTANVITLGMNTIMGLKMIIDPANKTIRTATRKGLVKLEVYHCDDAETKKNLKSVKGILVRKDSRNQKFAISSTQMQSIKNIEDMKLYRDISEENQEIEMKFRMTDAEIKEFHKNLENWKVKFGKVRGRIKGIKHRIYLERNTLPIKQKYYNCNPATKKILQEQLKELIKKGFVRESKSPWSSPVLLTKKKTGDFRMCIDYRKLNEKTKKDAFPLPQINSILQNLKDANYISALDLQSGYHQIELEDDSIEYTAFTVPGAGLYEFTVLPFGLTSAPATFQHSMQVILRKVIDKGVYVYLDDILITGRTLEEHNKNLNATLELLFEAGCEINWKKCFFLEPYVEYLGYTVGQGLLKTSPSKIEAIKSFPQPKTKKGVRSFLGLTGWYRRFIQYYAERSKPLTKLTENDSEFVWGEAQESAFQDLKNALICKPILTCPDFSKPFELHTDASGVGLGAVLIQKIDGVERVIGFFSKTLGKAERNYTVTELECLAIIKAIKHFRPFLEFQKFKVMTDHSALQYLQRLENPKGRLARWAIYLSQYDYEIIHRQGKYMAVPDALSRSAYNVEGENVEELRPTVKSFNARIFLNAINLRTLDFSRVTDVWYVNLRNRILERPVAYSSFIVRGEKIFKIVQDELTQEISRKLVIPKDFRDFIMEQCHKKPQAPHLGYLKTLKRVKSFFYWPNMAVDIKDFVFTCRVCQQFKIPRTQPPGLKDPTAVIMTPATAWSMDFIGPLPMTRKRNRYIFVLLDMCSRWLVTSPCRSATAAHVIKTLDTLKVQFGKPSLLLADNGKQFPSRPLKKYCEDNGIDLHLIPKYCPKTNIVERHNQTLKTSLRIYCSSDQRSWDEHLPLVTHGLNTSVSETTKYTPAKIMYGFELKPLFAEFRETDDSDLREFDPEEYVNTKEYATAKLYKRILQACEKAKRREAHQYNLRRRAVGYEEGQLVWRRNHQKSDKAKFISAKLLPPYVGPYKIAKVLAPNQYELKTLQGKSLGRWNVDDLKPFV